MRSTTPKRLALMRRLQSGHPVPASTPSGRPSSARDPQVADMTWVARRSSPGAGVTLALDAGAVVSTQSDLIERWVEWKASRQIHGQPPREAGSEA